MTEHQARRPGSSICSVAVITATYNAAMHIQQCINSVESQTYPHVFHVIVDGRSDDHDARDDGDVGRVLALTTTCQQNCCGLRIDPRDDSD